MKPRSLITTLFLLFAFIFGFAFFSHSTQVDALIADGANAIDEIGQYSTTAGRAVAMIV